MEKPGVRFILEAMIDISNNDGDMKAFEKLRLMYLDMNGEDERFMSFFGDLSITRHTNVISDSTGEIPEVWQCNDCGAHANSIGEIRHHDTCVPGESKKWERFYQKNNDLGGAASG